MPCNALYFHVPFCLRKCPYCDFYSVPAREDRMDAYTRAAVRAIETAPFPVGELETVYFGGGTPSLLGGERVARLLDAARARFGIAPGAEVTAECNPHSTLERELHRMAEAGVNRISLGMQSADDRQLAALGRPHTAADVAAAVDAARRAGISHISLDLMLATPGQTPADVDRAADFCAALGAEHVSAYLLKIEPGTPFATPSGTAPTRTARRTPTSTRWRRWPPGAMNSTRSAILRGRGGSRATTSTTGTAGNTWASARRPTRSWPGGGGTFPGTWRAFSRRRTPGRCSWTTDRAAARRNT